jgi:hypothetical protein
MATVKIGLVVALAASLTLVLTAQQRSRFTDLPVQITPSTLGRAPLVPLGSLKNPVSVIGAIAVPPFLSSIDILWVDQSKGRLYIADRSNAGPNGVVVTPEKILWAGDSEAPCRSSI